MKNTKIRFGLLLLVSAQLMHADFTASEVTNLGKLNEAEHKLEKPSVVVAGMLGFSGGAILASLGGALAQKTVGCEETEWVPGLLTIIGAVTGSVSEALYAKRALNLYHNAQGLDVHAAAARNDIEALKAFKAAGVTLVSQDVRGRTPLMYAAAMGAHDAANFLLQEGPAQAWTVTDSNTVKRVPTVDVQDMHGRTAALYAALNKHPEIVQKLKQDHAADLKLKDRDGNSVELMEQKNAKPTGFFSWFKW